MSGFGYFKNPVKADVGPDLLDPMDLTNSMNTKLLAAYDGDPLVLTTVDGGSAPRLRKVIQDDIDDLWDNGSGATGLIGFTPAAVATDSSGNMTTVPASVNLFANVAPIYQVPSMTGYGPKNLSSGRLRSSVYSCLNYISGNLWETTAVTDALIGTLVGMLISTISGSAQQFFWSTAATTKIARIVAIDDQNPLFNTTGTANVQDTSSYPRCPIIVQILPAYNQANNGLVYAD